QVDEVTVAGVRLFVPVWESVNLAALVLTAAALVAMLRFKVGMIPTLGAAAVLGAAYFYGVG
ncbi:MAG TPA: chromate transporter, partial [Kiloniellales bacterium]